MSSLVLSSTADTTSAAGAMLMRQVGGPVLVGVMLAGFGTSTAHALPLEVVVQHISDQTSAGASVPVAGPAGAAINELRRLSGLTWDQLARLFSVSRRSLHFWASGKPMTPSNEEHLQRLLAVVRKVDRGSASANRTMLLRGREDGSIPVDLLAAGDYDRVFSLLGPGEVRRATPPKLSDEARAARAPRPPDELVRALQDRVHRDGGRARAARSVRVRGGR
jgi:DNA-binding transcriptional regulator YiaG